MDRLSKLRMCSSTDVGLNSSCQSLGNGAGYETANEDSITSGNSLYYTMTDEGSERTGINVESISASSGIVGGRKEEMREDDSIDQTLENDFSVEEVSTIRKPMIMTASPATVKVTSKMSCKYLGVSSTPAKVLQNNGKNLSGIASLNDTNDKKLPSAMKKMREPMVSECSLTEDDDESKMTLESSVQSVVDASVAQKSFGTNVLAEFFDKLDVNKATPLPQIKIENPEDDCVKTTPDKRRSSNRLQNFFESLKKMPNEQPDKENRPQSERKHSLRKSLIPKVEERARARSSSVGIKLNDNRVASPIVKPSRKSISVKLLPDRLKEMRKDNQSELISVKRKSVIPAAKTVLARASTVTKSEQVIGDSIIVGSNRKSVIPAPKVGTMPVKPAANIGMKRKSVVPSSIASRKSVLPTKTLRRSVAAAPPKVPLKVPAKTTINNNDNSRRISLGKRATTDSSAEPLAKQRKSLAPIRESKIQNSSKDATKPTSRIKPPSLVTPVSTAFKKPESFTCGICQRPFRLKSSLETHNKLAHQSDMALPGTSLESDKTSNTKCRFCSKTFINGKILLNHLISNCMNIPIPEKRKLLAQDDLQRASSSKSSPTTIPSNNTLSTTAGVAISDTSTSSSIGDTSANSANGNGPSQKASSTGAIRKKSRTVGHTGITRTPKKELKCHLCGRIFLNAVEYALHVQAHAKGVESLKGTKKPDAEQSETTPTDESRPGEAQFHSNDASKLVQKLIKLAKK